MPRLHSDRSRPYPGRPVRPAVQLPLDSIRYGNMLEDRTGVSRGHSSSPKANEGPNPEQGKGPASSTIATNPTGGAIGRRVADKPDPNEYLLELILARPNLHKAWERVKANKGAPGVDNMPIDDFMAFAREHWERIRSSIFAGTYQPLPVKRVEIPKATGGTRPLGIPAVLDRLIQQAIPRYCCRYSIRIFRNRVSVSVRDVLPTMPSTKSATTSARDIAWRSTPIWRNFSTPWSMTSSCAGSAERCAISASCN